MTLTCTLWCSGSSNYANSTLCRHLGLAPRARH